jgi:hypothetical protein
LLVSGDGLGGGILKFGSLGRMLISASLVRLDATDDASLGLVIKSGNSVFLLRGIGGAFGSRGFLVLLGLDAPVFVAELPSGCELFKFCLCKNKWRIIYLPSTPKFFIEKVDI